MKLFFKFFFSSLIVISLQLSGNCYAQNNSIVIDGAYIVLDGGTAANNIFIVVDQPSPSGIVRLPAGGHIHSENQYNFVKWNSGTTIGNYTFPFGIGGITANYIPFKFNKTAGNSSISTSTWSTNIQNLPHPAATNVGPVTAMPGITDSVLHALDRFWDIRVTTTTANLTFSYKGIENTVFSPTSIVKAQHWNGNLWDLPVGPGTPGVNSGIGTAGPFMGQTTFSPWALIIPCGADSVFQNPQICQGSSVTVGTNTYSTTGIYVNNFINILGCDSVVKTNLIVHPIATSTDIQTACDSFNWIDGNTYTTNNNTATHTLVGGAATGCDSIVTLSLTMNSTATGTDVQIACENFTWIDGNTYTNSNSTATHVLVGGAVSGCDSIVTLNLTMQSPPIINATSNGPICEKEILNLSATFLNGGVYQWIGPNGFTAAIQNPALNTTSAISSGTYTVLVSAGNGCTGSAQVNVLVNPLPIITSVIKDDSCTSTVGAISVSVTSPHRPVTYSWDIGSADSSLIDLSEGTYTLTVTDNLSCSATKPYGIFNNKFECNCFIYVANAFTPNGDNNNDLIPVRGECIRYLLFKIFNRWGNLVFETDQLDHGWDGYYKGELQNTGIFVYTLEATFSNGENIKQSGDITLIR